MKKQRIVYLLPVKIKSAVKLHQFLIMGIIIGFALLACSKEERIEASVEGRVTTYGSNDAASKEPMTVELAQFTAGGLLAGGEKLVATTETNSEGYFRFEWKADDVVHYIRVKPEDTPPLHKEMNPTGGIQFYPGKGVQEDIELTAFGWLQLHVVNINPQEGDALYISRGGYSPEFFGSANDTVLLKEGGGFYNEININLNRNGEWHLWTDSVYVPHFDTVYHTIEY